MLPIQALSCDVRQLSVCTMVEEHIASIGKPLNIFFIFCEFNGFSGFELFCGFWFFANQPTGTGDTLQMIHDTWHVTHGRFHVKGPRKKVNVKKWIFLK